MTSTPPTVAPDLIRGRASSDERLSFTTLEGLKRRAKRLKKETGCTHTQALNQVAVAGGYASFDHARRIMSIGA